MLQIMDQKRLPPRWLQWMKAIFKSGTYVVLLNGIPRKAFHYRKGVTQGDPLSPLLFVLAADFLQSVLNNARVNNLLSLPLPLTHDLDFPILQYADDTLIFMKGDVIELILLKEILSNFAEASSLKVNYEKFVMVPINISKERLHMLATSFGCPIGSLPFTYLGLPLSLSKPFVADFWP
jgi:hypothetical protein